MSDLIDKIPAWVLVFVIPALLAAAAVVAKKTKNKFDDWLVELLSAAFLKFLGAKALELEADEDTDPATPGSIQLPDAGMTDRGSK